MGGGGGVWFVFCCENYEERRKERRKKRKEKEKERLVFGVWKITTPNHTTFFKY